MNATSSNHSNINGDAIRMFTRHLKDVCLTLPPVSICIIVAPYILALVDEIIYLVSQKPEFISYWLYFDYQKIVYSGQVFRLLTYPLCYDGLLMKLVIITFWLFPDLIKFERQKGSFQVIWLLMILFTLIPGIVYLFLIMITYTDKISPATNYSGMAGWVVALIFWSNLSDELNGVNQERYLFGSIRMPSKFMPILALIFFVILVPDGSFILNLACAGVSYLYVHTKLPKFLFLSNETVIRYEEKPWLRGLTRLPNFVPVDARFNYLPIATHDVDTNTADTTTTSFPGRGYRLGT